MTSIAIPTENKRQKAIEALVHALKDMRKIAPSIRDIDNTDALLTKAMEGLLGSDPTDKDINELVEALKIRRKISASIREYEFADKVQAKWEAIRPTSSF